MLRPILGKSATRGTSIVIGLIGLSGQLLSLVNHRLFWRFCNFFGQLLDDSYYCVVGLNTHARMKIFLNDPYWSRLVASSYRYEPDFEKILDKIEPLDYVFLDCGANFGYWSILISAAKPENAQIISIEASPYTYAILEENCQLNQHRFKPVHFAISSQSGDLVAMEVNHGHAGAHIVASNGSTDHLVQTITLDDAYERFLPNSPDEILVKLDVEGQEINAFRGAERLLDKDVLFYYEDHGKDTHSEVTRFILEEVGLKVFFCQDNGNIVPIESPERASRLKTRKTYGYNFLACKENSRFLSCLISS